MRILWMLTLVLIAAVLPMTAGGSAATAAEPVCSELVSSAPCDSDRDGFSDSLEKKVCGTATCATGREDKDSDGIPDTSEFVVCGEATCADPARDNDRDGIPDFAEIYVCGEIPNPASHGLSPRVGSVRVMDPTDSKQNGYVVYQNSNPTNPQAVNPVTGQTMKKSDPYWHIEFGPND